MTASDDDWSAVFEKPFLPTQRAVILVAETMATYQRKRRFRRPLTPFAFVPMAREIVGTLFLLPHGRAIVDDISAASNASSKES